MLLPEYVADDGGRSVPTGRPEAFRFVVAAPVEDLVADEELGGDRFGEAGAAARGKCARERGIVPQRMCAEHRSCQHGDALAEGGLLVHAVVQRELSALGEERVREA